MARTPHLHLVPTGPDVSPGGVTPAPHEPVLTIDCAVCEVRDTDACDDCLVSYLVGHEAGTPVELDADEKRAVDLLAEAGLVPGSRFAPRPVGA